MAKLFIAQSISAVALLLAAHSSSAVDEPDQTVAGPTESAVLAMLAEMKMMANSGELIDAAVASRITKLEWHELVYEGPSRSRNFEPVVAPASPYQGGHLIVGQLPNGAPSAILSILFDKNVCLTKPMVERVFGTASVPYFSSPPEFATSNEEMGQGPYKYDYPQTHMTIALDG